MKSLRKRLVNKLDKVHSLLIRAKNDRCVICGTTEQLQCGHLFTRVRYATRWDTAEDGNSHAQCQRCNFLHEYDSYPFFNYYINRFGKDKLDALHVRSQTIRKYSNAELEAKYYEISQELKTLKSS